MDSTTIHVRLTDEPVAVWRPVAAVKQASSVYTILADQPVPEDEEWEFPPGSIVLVEDKEMSDGPCKMAVKLAPRDSCYTYFKITGNFEPDDITRALGLSPDEAWRIGDMRRTGTQFDFAMWRYGLCEEYDVMVEEQMMATIRDLVPKTAELRAIKQQYDVTFTLVIVPALYPYDGEPTPRLAPGREVVAFCHETETDIDIDLYLYDAALMEDLEERRPGKEEKDAVAATWPRLRYTLTKEARLEFNIYHTEHSATISRQTRKARILPPLIWLLVALGFQAFFYYRFGRGPLWFPVIVFAASALWFLLYPLCRRWWVRKTLASYLGEIEGKDPLNATLELRDDRLRAEADDGMTEARYAEVEKLVENKGCLYIYVGWAMAFIVPLEAFGGEAAYRKFREELELKIKAAKEAP